MRRIAVLTLFTTGCFAVPEARAPIDGVPLARFDRVDEGVYRSAQPSRAQLDALVARYGLRTIVKLNRGSDAAPPGVGLIRAPLDPMREPSRDELAKLLDAIDAAPKPLLIHCTHGEDRTGLIVALYRLRHGATVEQAYVEMVRHRFHPYRGLWRAWLRQVGW